MDIYRERRQRLLDAMGPGGVALLRTHRAARRSNDTEYRFRPHSDFLYLTGLEEPETACVLRAGAEAPYRLFVRPRDRDREIWEGRRVGVEGAVSRHGADAAEPIDALEARLADWIGAQTLYVALGADPEFDQRLLAALARLKAAERRGPRMPRQLVDVGEVLHEMRLVKTSAEVEVLRRAAAITAEAHRAAMAATAPGVGEHEIEALIDYTFRRRGGSGPGYTTIVGGGRNATILHYIDNAEALRPGELLLVDAGCEVGWYTADVTRTWPVDGRFTPAQRRAYEVVLRAQLAAVAAVAPGATVDGIHEATVEHLTAGMVELGLLQGEVKDLIAAGAFRRFYMHRTSHWLGMDVHDVGRYYDAPDSPRPLAPGMVITVEPGLYIPEDAEDVPAELRGLGIRIEDDVLVTATGHEVLTAAVPKAVEDLEALVGRAVRAQAAAG